MLPFFFPSTAFFFRFTVYLICHASLVYKASFSLMFLPFPYFYVSVFFVSFSSPLFRVWLCWAVQIFFLVVVVVVSVLLVG